MDKIKFAMLVAWVSRLVTHGRELDEDDIERLNELVGLPPAPKLELPVDYVCKDDVARAINEIIQCMKVGNKIHAIKAHRQITGYGLKESKDEIEYLWFEVRNERDRGAVNIAHHLSQINTAALNVGECAKALEKVVASAKELFKDSE